MINGLSVLQRMAFNTESYTRAIQEVRERIEGGDDKLKGAIDLIMNITGETREYEDERFALHVAQGVVERVIRQGDEFDPIKAIADAEQTATKLRDNPAMQWLNAQPTDQPAQLKVTKTIAGVELTVKDNGKFKKGGKQDAATALFKEHMIGTGKSNGEFVVILMKELGMSKPGATTYAYNARKLVEAETGQKVDIVKSKKGRKAKV